MRNYPLRGVEHIHMMRRVPRSYDMSRTHILHKSVNRHVDVILRCAPKNWKKKKVRVQLVASGRNGECVKICAHAKRGYIAVKKVRSPEYEKDRKNIASFDESSVVRYDKTIGSRVLIHDLNSQIAIMAKKSGDYIENQLADKTASETEVKEAPALSAVPTVTAEKNPQSSQAESKSVYNPYESDYSKHVSNEDFHNLMDALEKSLDEACKKYNVDFDSSKSENADVFSGVSSNEFVPSTVSSYPSKSEFNLSVSSTSSVPYSANEGDFKLTGTSEKEEEFKPINVFPKEEEEEFKPVNSFPKEEEEEFKPVNVFPKEEEEEFKPVNVFPKEEEEEFKPINVFPKEEEEEFKPINVFPKEEEEEYKPVNSFPPQQNINYNSGDYDMDFADERPVQKFFSRTGDQIKKVIGIIRGKVSNKDDSEYSDHNENVDITYSDSHDDRRY